MVITVTPETVKTIIIQIGREVGLDAGKKGEGLLLLRECLGGYSRRFGRLAVGRVSGVGIWGGGSGWTVLKRRARAT